ncbi:MAG TPA: ribosome-associated translation inhibitor RaiA [Caldilineaceae bacterium]|nr:ribosome-associated translation inhibitor RaiA [Caldilineaceae bacterium]
MNLNIHGRNIEVTDWIHQYVEKKVGRLERYLPQVKEAKAELVYTETRAAADRYTAQLTIWTNGQILRAEESTDDIFASIDAIVDKMSRQIERYKGRRFKNKRRIAAAGAAEADLAATTLPEEAEVEAEEASGHVVRTKRFLVQPMTLEDAVEQMELLGHDFFIYFSVGANAMNVLYRRKDGNYGLLQPEQG